MGFQKKIAYRLRTLREAAGLSQQDIAERADLSLSLVAKMEQGRKADPRASTLIALGTALGVRPGQLIEDLEKPPEGAFPAKGKKGKKKKKKNRPDPEVGADVPAAPAAPGDGPSEPPTLSDAVAPDPVAPKAARVREPKRAARV